MHCSVPDGEPIGSATLITTTGIAFGLIARAADNAGVRWLFLPNLLIGAGRPRLSAGGGLTVAMLMMNCTFMWVSFRLAPSPAL